MENPQVTDDFFYACLMSLPGHVFWKDKKGTYLGANPAYLKLLGLRSLKQLVGKTDEDFFDKPQAKLIAKNIRQALRTDETVSFQQNFKKSKKITTLTISQSPLKNSKGKVLGVIGTVKNEGMSEKEIELQNQTAQILNNIPGSVYWKDTKGAYLGCNYYMTRMTGLNNPSQVVGKTDRELRWKDTAKDYIKNDRLVIKSKKEHEFTEHVTLKDGSQLEFLTRKTPLTDSKGNITGVLGISLDITKLNQTIKRLEEEKNRAERAEQAQNDFIAKLVNYIPGSVYWKDKKGAYLGCNNFVCAMAGLNHPNQIIGKTDSQLIWKNIAKNLRKNDFLVMKTKKELEFQETMVLADDRKIEVLTRKTPLKDEKSNIIGVLGVSLDITELNESIQRLEEEKQRAKLASQAKNDFIANMSHDIRTPLIGMLKLAERIHNKIRDTSLTEDTKDMLAAGNALFELVNDMVHAARLITQDTETQQIEFSLQPIFSKLIDLYTPEAEQKGVALNLYYDKKIPEYLVGDPLQLQRIILNLLGNAIKFTHKGSVDLSAKLIKNKKDSVLLDITLSDTGIGMPQDKLTYIFEPFTRLHGSYESTYSGLGLGLSAVKKYIEGMGGTISVQSELEKGSTFSCVIPLKKSLRNGTSMSHGHSMLPVVQTKSKFVIAENKKRHPIPPSLPLTILLAEDNLLVQRLLKDQIEELGHKVFTATNAKEVLNLLEIHTFDFIFMDIGLPDMSGDKLTAKIRAFKKNPNQAVPIVAQTAHSDPEKEILCLKSGMQAIVEKPLTTEQMQDLLETYVFQAELEPA